MFQRFIPLTVLFALAAAPETHAQQKVPLRFTISPNTPVNELLPKAPSALPRPSTHKDADLAQVPELAFGEPIAHKAASAKVFAEVAHTIAKINHLNQQHADGFMRALIANRADLRGLPFRMGDDCRTNERDAEQLMQMAAAVRDDKFGASPIAKRAPAIYVRALSQIMPADSHRWRLARGLAAVDHVDATQALAKLALYAPEKETRADAVHWLEARRESDYTDLLLAGFRYPLPAVSMRAAEAIVQLKCKDLLPDLVKVLDEPDPRAPVKEQRDGKEVTVVRELVRVNHHRNCLLCHAPGNTPNVPAKVLQVAVPLPMEALNGPSTYYRSTPGPDDLVIRTDMTYLRQDFSLMMPVADSSPWPEMQRFDFLVRTRELNAGEAKAYATGEELPLNHRAALYALRALTGRDAAPTAAAWRQVLQQ